MTYDDYGFSSTGLRHRVHDSTLLAQDRGPADSPTALWPVDADFSFAGATDWINSPPLTGSDLRGRVVLINFWTYTCINWLRQLPYIRAWDESYRRHGLVVIGVHAPESSFEHDEDNVRRAAEIRRIDYPIAIDNHFAVWRSFHDHFWAANYVVDPIGQLRHHSFGEGGHEETEAIVRQLLTEAGAGDLGAGPVAVKPQAVEAPADWDSLGSGEIYLGFDRTTDFASAGGVLADQPRAYSIPVRLRLGHWALSGMWTLGRESTALHTSGGRLACRFHARDVHLVVAPAARGSAVRFRVLLDGREPPLATRAARVAGRCRRGCCPPRAGSPALRRRTQRGPA